MEGLLPSVHTHLDPLLSTLRAYDIIQNLIRLHKLNLLFIITARMQIPFITVEPLNNGHIGDRTLVLFREVVPTLASSPGFLGRGKRAREPGDEASP